MEFEFIKDVVKVDARKRNGAYASIIGDWLETENKTLKFKCSNMRERKNCMNSCRAYLKAHKEDFTIFLERGTLNVYLVKA